MKEIAARVLEQCGQTGYGDTLIQTLEKACSRLFPTEGLELDKGAGSTGSSEESTDRSEKLKADPKELLKKRIQYLANIYDKELSFFGEADPNNKTRSFSMSSLMEACKREVLDEVFGEAGLDGVNRICSINDDNAITNENTDLSQTETIPHKDQSETDTPSDADDLSSLPDNLYLSEVLQLLGDTAKSELREHGLVGLIGYLLIDISDDEDLNIGKLIAEKLSKSIGINSIEQYCEMVCKEANQQGIRTTILKQDDYNLLREIRNNRLRHWKNPCSVKSGLSSFHLICGLACLPKDCYFSRILRLLGETAMDAYKEYGLIGGIDYLQNVSSDKLKEVESIIKGIPKSMKIKTVKQYCERIIDETVLAKVCQIAQGDGNEDDFDKFVNRMYELTSHPQIHLSEVLLRLGDDAVSAFVADGLEGVIKHLQNKVSTEQARKNFKRESVEQYCEELNEAIKQDKKNGIIGLIDFMQNEPSSARHKRVRRLLEKKIPKCMKIKTVNQYCERIIENTVFHDINDSVFRVYELTSLPTSLHLSEVLLRLGSPALYEFKEHGLIGLIGYLLIDRTDEEDKRIRKLIKRLPQSMEIESIDQYCGRIGEEANRLGIRIADLKKDDYDLLCKTRESRLNNRKSDSETQSRMSSFRLVYELACLPDNLQFSKIVLLLGKEAVSCFAEKGLEGIAEYIPNNKKDLVKNKEIISIISQRSRRKAKITEDTEENIDDVYDKFIHRISKLKESLAEIKDLDEKALSDSCETVFGLFGRKYSSLSIVSALTKSASFRPQRIMILHLAVAFQLTVEEANGLLTHYNYHPLHAKSALDLAVTVVLNDLEKNGWNPGTNVFEQIFNQLTNSCSLYLKIKAGVITAVDKLTIPDAHNKSTRAVWDQAKGLTTSLLSEYLAANYDVFNERRSRLLAEYKRLIGVVYYLFNNGERGQGEERTLEKWCEDAEQVSFIDTYLKYMPTSNSYRKQKNATTIFLSNILNNGFHPTRELMIWLWIYEYCLSGYIPNNDEEASLSCGTGEKVIVQCNHKVGLRYLNQVLGVTDGKSESTETYSSLAQYLGIPYNYLPTIMIDQENHGLWNDEKQTVNPKAETVSAKLSELLKCTFDVSPKSVSKWVEKGNIELLSIDVTSLLHINNTTYIPWSGEELKARLNVKLSEFDLSLLDANIRDFDQAILGLCGLEMVFDEKVQNYIITYNEVNSVFSSIVDQTIANMFLKDDQYDDHKPFRYVIVHAYVEALSEANNARNQEKNTNFLSPLAFHPCE